MRGKFGIRENSDRNGQRQVNAHRDQRQDDENDRLAVARRPVRRFPIPVTGGSVESSLIFLFLILARRRLRWGVLVLVVVGFLDRRGNHFHLGFVIHAHAAHHDHLFAGGDAAQQLHLIAFAHAEFDRLRGRSTTNPPSAPPCRPLRLAKSRPPAQPMPPCIPQLRSRRERWFRA